MKRLALSSWKYCFKVCVFANGITISLFNTSIFRKLIIVIAHNSIQECKVDF